MTNEKIGLLYLSLHNQLKIKYGENVVITRKEFFTKLGRHYMIPKSIRPLLIREMLKKGLLERVNRDLLRIKKLNFSINQDIERVYSLMGKNGEEKQ